MKRFLVSFPLLALLTLAVAAQPQPIPPSDGKPAPKVTPAPFKFPFAIPKLTPPAPAPQPVPLPGDALKLAHGTVYVIPHDEAFLLIASSPTAPRPLVTITRTAGPLTVHGKFLDTPDTPAKLRTFTGKFLAIVEPVPGENGRIELIANPGTNTDETKVQRQLVDVGAGQGPQPPPDDKKDVAPPPKPTPPPVPPDPKPDPKPNPTGPLWLVIVYENDSLDLDTAAVINASAFWDKQRKAGNQFRPFDQNEPNAVKLGYVKAATQDRTDATGKVIRKAPGLPALVIVDHDGDVIRAVPLPKTTAAIDALVKEVSP